MKIAIHALLGMALGMSSPALAVCYLGCPLSQANDAATAPNRVVERSFYTLSNNAKTKFADWVAYTVTPESIGPTQARQWKRDPDLPASETLTPGDYKDASAALKIDRGHQAPLASFTSLPNWPEANYLSNITPQATALNQGPWEQLESAERALVRKSSINVHVVTGPLYERQMEPLPKATKDHVVPSGYWKVVVAERAGVLTTAAFVMHQDTPRSAKYCNQAVPIEDIEERAKLRLFPKVADARWQSVVKAPGSLLEALGCRIIDGGRAGARMVSEADAN
jgi:endonuclease G